VQTHVRDSVTIVGAIEKHRNRKAGTKPEEVEEEPMATARAQVEQRQATVKAQRKSGASFFLLSTLLSVCGKKGQRESQKKRPTETSSPLFLFFTKQWSARGIDSVENTGEPRRQLSGHRV
jgi:hypothetical protein